MLRLVAWRWWWKRRSEFRVVDRNVLFRRLELNGETISGPSLRPAERNFGAAGIAVVGEIDLQRIQAQGRVRITNHSQEQAGLFIEKETNVRFAVPLADNQPTGVTIDFVAIRHFQLGKHGA